MARLSPVELPTGEAKRATVTAMFDRVAPSYDRLNRLISLGQDARWRRRAIDGIDLPRGSRILDLACGTGDLCRGLVRDGYRPIGLDLSAGMLESSRLDTPLVRADVLRLPVPDHAVDGVTCGFALRNFVDLDAFVRECVRVLRPGGRVSFLDAAEPTGRLVRLGHGVWFRHAVPMIGGWLGDREAYRYLPASTAYLPEGDALVALLSSAGLDDVHRTTMMAGAVQLLTGTRAALHARGTDAS